MSKREWGAACVGEGWNFISAIDEDWAFSYFVDVSARYESMRALVDAVCSTLEVDDSHGVTEGLPSFKVIERQCRSRLARPETRKWLRELVVVAKVQVK